MTSLKGKMKRVFKIIGISAGILAGIIVFLYALFWVFAFFVVFNNPLDNPFNNKDFDKTTWAQFDNNYDPDNPRGKMYEDLIENHLSKGMSKEEVINLLGKPDFESEEYFLSYNLGMWSGGRMDYDSLDLKFNRDGKLSEFYRVQH